MKPAEFALDTAGAAKDAEGLYSPPRLVTDLGDCCFYHTMDIPGYGTVEGQWDLRPGLDTYLGGVHFRGKRVLEIGTASGFLCFHMERLGAEVVAYDLSEAQAWDLVPFASQDSKQLGHVHRGIIRKLNNGYWLNHRACGSRARMVYGTVYTVPESIGPVDVATMCCVLTHVRDPFLALAMALKHARETAIVVEALAPLNESATATPRLSPAERLLRRVSRTVRRFIPHPPGVPCMAFRPDPQSGAPADVWWTLTPEIICTFLGVLGFPETRVTYHEQLYKGRPQKMFTVVGHRRPGAAAAQAA